LGGEISGVGGLYFVDTVGQGKPFLGELADGLEQPVPSVASDLLG
jgi:hypothetical protein